MWAQVSVHTGGFLSSSLTRSVDYFNPTFAAPQLTPKQFLIISSPSEQKIVYTELKRLGFGCL